MALGSQFSRLAAGIVLRLPAAGSTGGGWLRLASLMKGTVELGLRL